MELQKLKLKYFGNEAAEYDQKRHQERIWPIEQSAVYEHLRYILKHSHAPLFVLDIPVGTGRFFEQYKELSCSVIGMDVSDEMLKHAKQESERVHLDVNLQMSDVLAINLTDQAVDVAVCMRLLNLFGFEEFRNAVEELARVTRRYVICGVAVRPSLHDTPVLSRLMTISRRYVTDLIEYIRHGAGGFIRHPEEDVLSTFKSHGLNVISNARVDSKKGGYAYYIYLLEK